MSPIEAVYQWMQEDSRLAALRFYRGMWQDDVSNATERLCCIAVSGGRTPVIDTDYSTVDVWLLGASNNEAELLPIEELAYGIRDRLKADWRVCGVIQLKLLGQPVGPGFTDENRVWWRVTLEVTQ